MIPFVFDIRKALADGPLLKGTTTVVYGGEFLVNPTAEQVGELIERGKSTEQRGDS